MQPLNPIFILMSRYFAFATMLLFLTSCCKDEETVTECPCLADDQGALYKTCLPIVDYNQAKDCNLQEIPAQVYANVKYPAKAREDSIQGGVVIGFDIFEDGSMGNYTVVFDTVGYGLPEAAIAGARSLEAVGFCPAMENCNPVTYHFELPVSFKLF